MFFSFSLCKEFENSFYLFFNREINKKGLKKMEIYVQYNLIFYVLAFLSYVFFFIIGLLCYKLMKERSKEIISYLFVLSVMSMFLIILFVPVISAKMGYAKKINVEDWQKKVSIKPINENKVNLYNRAGERIYLGTDKELIDLFSKTLEFEKEHLEEDKELEKKIKEQKDLTIVGKRQWISFEIKRRRFFEEDIIQLRDKETDRVYFMKEKDFNSIKKNSFF